MAQDVVCIPESAENEKEVEPHVELLLGERIVVIELKEDDKVSALLRIESNTNIISI